MPIYEYQCNACGYQLEKLQKTSAEPLKECPKCGKLELQKLISQTSFKLTGTGWYETDFNYDIGDVNQDLVINILDVVAVVNGILDGNISGIEYYLADINEDGLINILDIINIVNIILDN